MSRIVLSKGRQKEFLNKIHKVGALDWPDMANICDASERAIRDWRREKYYMKHEALMALSRETSVDFGHIEKILPDHWSVKKAASVGAKRRYEMYGNPGTPGGRKKGGINSQRKFRDNPKYAEKLGIKVKKVIKIPKNSPELAEFIGLLLGDGGITKYFVTISFNRETDKKHSIYMQELVKKLFRVSSSIISGRNRDDKADNVVIYSKNLVEFLRKKGLKPGNKINNKIDIPCWIKSKKECKIACVRGLIDTDGSFYSYKNKIGGKTYKNFAICFTNYSVPLLNSVYQILKELRFKPTQTGQRVYLHKKKDIEEYVNTVGSHNPKHVNKYKAYKKERYGSGCNRAVLKTA